SDRLGMRLAPTTGFVRIGDVEQLHDRTEVLLPRHPGIRRDARDACAVSQRWQHLFGEVARANEVDGDALNRAERVRHASAVEQEVDRPDVAQPGGGVVYLRWIGEVSGVVLGVRHLRLTNVDRVHLGTEIAQYPGCSFAHAGRTSGDDDRGPAIAEAI